MKMKMKMKNEKEKERDKKKNDDETREYREKEQKAVSLHGYDGDAALLAGTASKKTVTRHEAKTKKHHSSLYWSKRRTLAYGASARVLFLSRPKTAGGPTVVWTTPCKLDPHSALVRTSTHIPSVEPRPQRALKKTKANHGHESTAVQFVFGIRASFAKPHVVVRTILCLVDQL